MVVILIADNMMDFCHVVGNITPSLVESLGEFLICRLVEGLWEVDNGRRVSSGSSSFGGANFHPQRTSWREGTANRVSWQIDDDRRLVAAS
mmetsp:Transcript_23975/g.41991  ORF Transcript_23975/g.41991 Transcript_23975/m.41991 type:complete len:91 (-) Transcript_23975:156-428(-)